MYNLKLNLLFLGFYLLQCGNLVVAKPFNATKHNNGLSSPDQPSVSVGRDEPAQPCDETKCKLPLCRCANTNIPGGLDPKQTPQIITINFDDGFRDLDYQTYYKPIFTNRKNPNGCQVGLTYFVSHNYTDYALMEHVYSNDGAEFADHSVTHRSPTTWWEDATEEEWSHEINDQRSILELWGGMGKDEVRGFRSPFLVTSETELKVLHESSFLYEASMGTTTNYWPFTLDYESPICISPATCPKNAYPGLWLVPIALYKQSNGNYCAMLDACTTPITEEDWFNFLMENFNAHYDYNRSPFGIYSHSAWFYISDVRAKAMEAFLDKVLAFEDVYIVTQSQMLDWVSQPVALDKIKDFDSWKCPPRPAPRCDYMQPTCQKMYEDKYFKSCSSCPNNYPSYGNPEGK